MILRVLPLVIGVSYFWNAFEAFTGRSKLREPVPQGYFDREMTGPERLTLGANALIFGVLLLLFAVLPEGMRVRYELVAGMICGLVGGVVAFVLAPRPGAAVPPVAQRSPQHSEMAVTLTPSDAVSDRVGALTPVQWRTPIMLVGPFVYAAGCLFVLAGLVPDAVTGLLDDIDYVAGDVDAVATVAIVALIAVIAAAALVGSILTLRGENALGAAVVLAALGAFVGIGWLLGEFQEVLRTARDVVGWPAN